MPGRDRFMSGRWRSTRRRWGRASRYGREPQQPRATSLRLRATMPGRGRFMSGRWRSTRRRWGRSIPNTAMSLNNLASLLQARATTRAAQPLHERALAIQEKALGPEHPDTARASTTSAFCFFRPRATRRRAAATTSGRWQSGRRRSAPSIPTRRRASATSPSCSRPRATSPARPLFERALAIEEKALGDEHPNTATT